MVWFSLRLDHERRARREDEVVQVIEPIDARAERPAEVIGQEDLVLHVDAELRAVVRLRRDREIERVEPQVATVGDDVAVGERLNVRQLEVARSSC